MNKLGLEKGKPKPALSTLWLSFFEIHIQHFVHHKYFIECGSILLLLALVLPLGPTHRPLVGPGLVFGSLRHHRVRL